MTLEKGVIGLKHVSFCGDRQIIVKIPTPKEGAIKKTRKGIGGRFGSWGLAGSLALLMVGSLAQAKQPIDMMSCGSGTTIPIVANEEMTILDLEHKGINIDNFRSKAFDNMTYQTAC